MKILKYTFVGLLIFGWFACSGSQLGGTGTTPPSHQPWDQLLKAHVDKDGTVDYKGFIRDKGKLEAYPKTHPIDPSGQKMNN